MQAEADDLMELPGMTCLQANRRIFDDILDPNHTAILRHDKVTAALTPPELDLDFISRSDPYRRTMLMALLKAK
jgi:hypothetical protein